MVPIKAKVFVTVKKCHEYSTEQVRYLKMFFVMHQHNLGRASLKQIKKIIDSVKKYNEVVRFLQNNFSSENLEKIHLLFNIFL
jgi:ABC-type Zn uptake system ZnuABC Zn-binding protein ZnuA